MELSPFTRTDWYGFAGAERFSNGDEPRIAYFDNPSAIVTHDDYSIQVSLRNAEGDLDAIYDLRCSRRMGEVILAGMDASHLTADNLTALGFERIG